MDTAGLKERARHELRAYTILAIYLYVCLGALLLFKTALLRQEGIGFLPHGLAAIKALILAKFLLIGEAVGAGAWRNARTLIGAIVRKVALLLVVLVVLSLAEELAVGWLHGRALAQTLAEIGQHSWLQVLAGAVLMLLVLLPLVTAKEISDALEPGALRQLLLSASERRPGAPGHESTRADRPGDGAVATKQRPENQVPREIP